MKNESLAVLEKQHSAAETIDQSAHVFDGPRTGDEPMRASLPAPLPPAAPSAEDKAFGLVLVSAAWSIVGWLLIHLPDLVVVLQGGYPLLASRAWAMLVALV